MSASLPASLPFPPGPKARASLKAGTLYAIDAGDSCIYYGQVTPEKRIGFFRFRSDTIDPAAALSSGVMSCFVVGYPSIGRALRAGTWFNLGRHPLHPQLQEEAAMVQWPVGTLEVAIWKGGVVVGTTRVEAPEIQHLEILAAYDAVYHVPDRLRRDYTGGPDDRFLGGSIRRERLKKEAFARLHPDAPWHRLPADWVPVDEK